MSWDWTLFEYFLNLNIEPNRIETDIDSFKSIDAAPDTPLGEEAPGEDTEEVQMWRGGRPGEGRAAQHSD